MRISDWSSDVCSSDLCSQQDAPHRGTMGRKRTTDHQRCGNDLVLFGARNVNDALAITIIERCDGNRFLQSIAARVHQGLARAGKRRRDRKRVVWGKSVAVRVDLGGRRIIKKKNKMNKT